MERQNHPREHSSVFHGKAMHSLHSTPSQGLSETSSPSDGTPNPSLHCKQCLERRTRPTKPRTRPTERPWAWAPARTTDRPWACIALQCVHPVGMQGPFNETPLGVGFCPSDGTPLGVGPCPCEACEACGAYEACEACETCPRKAWGFSSKPCLLPRIASQLRIEARI
jgi:hypothetical protein